MRTIRFQGREIVLAQGETVLDALLRSGITMTHSCRAGVCGSCLMRSAAGSVPSRAQAGMKDSWKARGYFYSCVCVPDGDIEIASPGEDVRTAAMITSLRFLSSDVLEARLTPEEPITFRAGQYVTVVRGLLARSYSVASLPEHGTLELHIRRIPGGQMSGWFHEGARVGERLSLVGPSGECFYIPGRAEQPIVLAGTGTGLAPLYGIVRDALRNDHRGPIHLFHGALRAEGLYLVEELRGLAAAYPNMRYTAALLQGEPADGIEIGPIDRVIHNYYPNLSGWRGYVCGDPGIVQMLKKKLFMTGMASREIYADAFLPAAVN